MIKRAILAIIALIMIVTGGAMLAYGQEINIDIKTETEKISVVENITVDSEQIDFIDIWEYPLDRIVVINGNTVTLPEMYNLPYSINLTEQNIALSDYYEVKYSLSKDTTSFGKIFIYNTTSILVTFDGDLIFAADTLEKQISFTVELQKPTQSQTTKETIPTWVYIIIIILVVLLIVLFAISTKKQKSTTKKEGIGGSEELLTTKKALLMETLKEIEKRHRGKQISDDTYHKLKDEFKQDAVESMKKLEDLKK